MQQQDAAASVSCMACSHEATLLAAGSGEGHASVADARCGAPVAWWKAHSTTVSAVSFVDGGQQHHLLTASTVSTTAHPVLMSDCEGHVTMGSMPQERGKGGKGAAGMLRAAGSINGLHGTGIKPRGS